MEKYVSRLICVLYIVYLSLWVWAHNFKCLQECAVFVSRLFLVLVWASVRVIAGLCLCLCTYMLEAYMCSVCVCFCLSAELSCNTAATTTTTVFQLSMHRRCLPPIAHVLFVYVCKVLLLIHIYSISSVSYFPCLTVHQFRFFNVHGGNLIPMQIFVQNFNAFEHWAVQSKTHSYWIYMSDIILSVLRQARNRVYLESARIIHAQ